jgi:CRISPR-associated protein Cas6
MRDPTPLTDGAAQRLQEAADAAANTVELSFEITGRTLPQDHRAALADALLSTLPWLADEPTVAVHPLRAPVGEAGQLLLPRRARLLLRLPRQRVEDARELCGQTLQVTDQSLQVGACAAPRELLATRTLHADFVCWDAPLAGFEAFTNAALTELGIESPWMSGGQRQALGPDGQTWLHGRALLLHDLPHRHALALQVIGLGPHRLLGCGLFKPHKLITGLSSEDD